MTGSLIPTDASVLPLPILRVTAEDIEQRGFAGVADAIQKSPFSNGAVSAPTPAIIRARGRRTCSRSARASPNI